MSDLQNWCIENKDGYWDNRKRECDITIDEGTNVNVRQNHNGGLTMHIRGAADGEVTIHTDEQVSFEENSTSPPANVFDLNPYMEANFAFEGDSTKIYGEKGRFGPESGL